jgi:hypothetical protein
MEKNTASLIIFTLFISFTFSNAQTPGNQLAAKAGINIKLNDFQVDGKITKVGHTYKVPFRVVVSANINPKDSFGLGFYETCGGSEDACLIDPNGVIAIAGDLMKDTVPTSIYFVHTTARCILLQMVNRRGMFLPQVTLVGSIFVDCNKASTDGKIKIRVKVDDSCSGLSTAKEGRIIETNETDNDKIITVALPLK